MRTGIFCRTETHSGCDSALGRDQSFLTPLPFVLTPVPLLLPAEPLAAALLALRVVGRPMFHPQPLKVLTIFGVTAAVKGTRTNMKLLWIA